MFSHQPFEFFNFFDSETERSYNYSYVYKPSSSTQVSYSISYTRRTGVANRRPLTPVLTLDNNSRELSTHLPLLSCSPMTHTSTKATHHRQKCKNADCTGFAVTRLPCDESKYEKMCSNCRTSKPKATTKVGNKRPLVVDLVGDDKSKSKLEKPKECPICAEEDVVLRPIKPCGHWMCEGCMVSMNKMECPYCRCKDIKLPKEVLAERRKKPRLA